MTNVSRKMSQGLLPSSIWRYWRESTTYSQISGKRGSKTRALYAKILFTSSQMNLPSTPLGHCPQVNRKPFGGPRPLPGFREEILRLVEAIRPHVGELISVRTWPYRHAGLIWWSFDADGTKEDISLTFAQSGKTRLPHDDPTEGVGEVYDALDAHYLFKVLTDGLSCSCSKGPRTMAK